MNDSSGRLTTLSVLKKCIISARLCCSLLQTVSVNVDRFIISFIEHHCYVIWFVEHHGHSLKNCSWVNQTIWSSQELLIWTLSRFYVLFWKNKSQWIHSSYHSSQYIYQYITFISSVTMTFKINSSALETFIHIGTKQ